MKKTLIEKTSDKIVNAFLTNKLIAPIPRQYSKKLINAQKFRKLCESKIKEPIVGFKAAGTAIPVMKKLKEKEPFYASIYKRNVVKSGGKVKINKGTLGIELEVCYQIKKSFFSSKGLITSKNISKFISIWHLALKLLVTDKEKKVLHLLVTCVVILVLM
jgi:2-keto-4-pentenoate hydratase